MLVEQVNDMRQSHDVTTLLYVNMNVDYKHYQWKQVIIKVYILNMFTIKCF